MERLPSQCFLFGSAIFRHPWRQRRRFSTSTRPRGRCRCSHPSMGRLHAPAARQTITGGKLHLTGVSTTLALWEEKTSFAISNELALPRCSQFGLRLPPQENESFIAAVVASFLSSQRGSVLTPHVSCNGHDHWKDLLLVVGGAFGLGFGCRFVQ